MQRRTFILPLCMLVFGHSTFAYENSLDGSMKFECPKDQFLSKIYSDHDNHYEDRYYEFGCQGLFPLTQIASCYWTGWVNDFDQPLLFKCSKNGIISGIQSYHDNYYEDRKFQFKCCEPFAVRTANCVYSDYLNEFDGPIDFKVPAGFVLKGLLSIHDDYYEDRKWFAEICNLVQM